MLDGMCALRGLSALSLLALVSTGACGGRIDPSAADPQPGDPSDPGAFDGGRAVPDDPPPLPPEPTPIDGGPIGDGGPSKCACASVTVTCNGSTGYASSNQAKCEIDMSSTSCSSLGLGAGSVTSPDALVTAPISKVNSALSAYDVCALRHEARHTCIDMKLTSFCASEVDAYAVSIKCLQDIDMVKCQGGSPPSWCSRIDDFIAAQRIASEFNACLCRAGTTCESCQKACLTAGGRTTCGESARAYCAANGK